MDIRTYPTHYKIEGVKYDRVTTVLGYFAPKPLVEWGLRVGKAEQRRVSKTAKAIGTRVDKISTAILSGMHWCITDKDNPAVRNCVRGFKNWLAEENPKVDDWQVTCYDEEMGIAGTRDFRIGKRIVDLKCANRISLSYWIQLATYAHLSGLEIDELAILRLDKMTGDYQYKVIPNSPDLLNLFKAILGYYRFNAEYDKLEEKEEDDGKRVEIATDEIQKKFGIFSPEVRTDWSIWHREI